MDVPHWPYWRKNSLGGAQAWYTDWGDCPFDAPDMGERDEEALGVDAEHLIWRSGEGTPCTSISRAPCAT